MPSKQSAHVFALAFCPCLRLGRGRFRSCHRRRHRFEESQLAADFSPGFWHFGLFQALMPVAGWLCGSAVTGLLGAYDHWIAFALLAAIGANMIREALTGEEERREKDATRGWSLVMLSVVTSIDALALGFSMSLLKTPIVLPAVVIGLIATCFTALGLHIGRLLASGGKRLSRCAEIVGGMVLLAIAINLLHEHGLFAP